MKLKDAEILGFDTETSGIDTETARIVTAAFVARKDDGSGWEIVENMIVNPGVPIPEGAQAVHGITDEYVQEHGEDPAEAVEVIVAYLESAWKEGIAVTAHNATYDLSLVAAEAKRHLNYDFRIKGPVIDTMVLFRMLGNKKASLDAASRRYGILNEGAHDAGHDAITTCRLLEAMIRSSQIGDQDLRDLFIAQRRYHREWAADLQSYFRKIGKEDTVDGDWPIRAKYYDDSPGS
jgi:DNA polymerase-3 subunit epsilon